jgi:sugar-specific transcriptional regulator TrmB
MELITPKEKRVLGALYRIGSSSIGTISKETLLNRTALYHTIEELLKKGLVTKINKEGGAYFQPIPLPEYQLWSKRQINSIASQTEELQHWLAAQKQNTPTLYSDVKYVEGTEGIKSLYTDTLIDNNEKVIYAITDYDKAYETLGDFFEKEYFPQRMENNIRVKSILSKSARTGKKDVDRSTVLLRDMKFINIFKNLGIEINIYGQKVSIVAFDKIKPSGIIIKNFVVANAFKVLFEYIWKNQDK